MGTPNSVYEKLDNEKPNLVISKTKYNEFGKIARREDYYQGSNPHAHFDKETQTNLNDHVHVFTYNNKGQPIGRGKVFPLDKEA